jgi:hypothetical protein
MYHLLSILDVRILAASNLFSEAWQPLLKCEGAQMSAALRTMTLADGEITLMNDSWIGEAPRAESMVDLSGVAPMERLSETGYVRLGCDGDSVVFDCGPCGPDENPGHAHADFLTIEATARRMRFLVDTGVPTYTAGYVRDASRSAAAHNGPRLIGEEPVEFWKSFRVGRRGYAGELSINPGGKDDVLQVAGWQNGYAHLGIDVRRAVCLWPGRGLLVADLWRGGTGDPATRFLIPDDWRLEDGPAFTQNATRLRVRALTGALVGPVTDNHWYHFDFARNAHRIDILPEGDNGIARAATLFSWSIDEFLPDQEFLGRLYRQLESAIPTQSELR